MNTESVVRCRGCGRLFAPEPQQRRTCSDACRRRRRQDLMRAYGQRRADRRARQRGYVSPLLGRVPVRFGPLAVGPDRCACGARLLFGTDGDGCATWWCPACRREGRVPRRAA